MLLPGLPSLMLHPAIPPATTHNSNHLPRPLLQITGMLASGNSGAGRIRRVPDSNLNRTLQLYNTLALATADCFLICPICSIRPMHCPLLPLVPSACPLCAS